MHTAPAHNTEIDLSPGGIDNEFVDTPGAAEELLLSKSKLTKMRCTGDGPPFYKIGSRVFYSRRELREWRRSCRRTSTSIHQAA